MKKNRLGNNLLIYYERSFEAAPGIRDIFWCRPQKIQNRLIVKVNDNGRAYIDSKGATHSIVGLKKNWPSFLDDTANTTVEDIKEVLSDKKYALLNLKHKSPLIRELCVVALEKNFVTNNIIQWDWNEYNSVLHELMAYAQEYKEGIILDHPLTMIRAKRKINYMKALTHKRNPLLKKYVRKNRSNHVAMDNS